MGGLAALGGKYFSYGTQKLPASGSRYSQAVLSPVDGSLGEKGWRGALAWGDAPPSIEVVRAHHARPKVGRRGLVHEIRLCAPISHLHELRVAGACTKLIRRRRDSSPSSGGQLNAIGNHSPGRVGNAARTTVEPHGWALQPRRGQVRRWVATASAVMSKAWEERG
ncbi:hypothetical protein GCM10009745_44040 [Kribbella yunnanensis]|uniref:Uncharacterized protein n=1 Tax=Kribbella yunnanensis TaxID=190194 RepID=A0ABN2HU83_9ACTN